MRKGYLIILLLLFSCGGAEDADGIRPQLSDITESVYASVTVRPEDSYLPQTTRSGIIREVYVEEGDTVQRGQVLFRIRPAAEVNNRLTTAQLNLKEAEANYLGQDNILLNIEAELVAMRQQLMLDSTNYKRQERLWQQKIGREVDYDRARLAYQATRSQYQVLQNKYAQTLTNLENTYRKALSQAKAEADMLGDYVVRSTLTGKVYAVYKEAGELISPQEPFGEIGSDKAFLLEMEIDEVDIARVSRGDSVTISLDAYPARTFLATITRISPKKNDLTQTFRVEARFLQAPPTLYNGLAGEANIIIARRKGAMVIPSDYLVEGDKVLTEEGEVPVETGVKNMAYTEILSGIDTTTVLLKPGQP